MAGTAVCASPVCFKQDEGRVVIFVPWLYIPLKPLFWLP